MSRKRQEYRDLRVHTTTANAQRKKDRKKDIRDTGDVRIHTTETQRRKTVMYGHTQLKHKDRMTVTERSVTRVVRTHTTNAQREKKKRQRLRYSERPLSEGLRRRRSYPAIID